MMDLFPLYNSLRIAAVSSVIVFFAGIAAAIVTGVEVSKDLAEKKRISDKVSPYDGLFCPGVYVDGIHLDGMTPEDPGRYLQYLSFWETSVPQSGHLAYQV